MKAIKLILLSLATIVLFASCGSDEVKSTSEYYYNDSFHHVYNVRSNSYKVYDEPQYMFEFDYINMLANIEISEVMFADGMPPIKMVLKNLKWRVNKGFRVIEATDVVPVVNGEEMPEYLINNITVELLDRYVGAYHEPIVNVCFVVNDMFKVTAVQKNIVYLGQTTVIGPSNSVPFTSNSQVYQLSINKDLTAKLRISGAKFAQGMPPFDMVFKDILVEVKSGLGYVLKSDALIPEIGNVPYPNYAITNLQGNGVFSTGLDLSFICNMKKTSDTGEEEIRPYSVNAVLDFSVPTE